MGEGFIAADIGSSWLYSDGVRIARVVMVGAEMQNQKLVRARISVRVIMGKWLDHVVTSAVTIKMVLVLHSITLRAPVD